MWGVGPGMLMMIINDVRWKLYGVITYYKCFRVPVGIFDATQA